MPRRPFGDTGLTVSALGLGTSARRRDDFVLVTKVGDDVEGADDWTAAASGPSRPP